MHAVFLIALLAVAAPNREDPTPKETTKPLQEQILGDWQLVKRVLGGNDNPNDRIGGIVSITSKTLQFRDKDQAAPEEETLYHLDVFKKPATIDLTPTRNNGAGNMIVRGIVKIENDTLTICFSFGGKGERPTEFTSPAQSTTALIQFTRIKK